MDPTSANQTPTTTSAAPPLHTSHPLRRTPFNRLFAALYSCALAALFYRHARNLLYSHSTFLSSLFLIADLILAAEWAATQAFRWRPLRRRQFPENLKSKLSESNPRFPPAVDVFICTADPFKEPPMGVVSTALSVMAYDYPPEKLSVYVSDDGGSQLTLFAFMEAARFARDWLPFCRKNKIQVRSPEVYFKGTDTCSDETQKIKRKYEDMKARVNKVVEVGAVREEHLQHKDEIEMFSKWTPDFTRNHHPTVIQVLLDRNEDKDGEGGGMPNLVYVSREKAPSLHHYYKAGALNTLMRVSATLTNSPIMLILDCDMYSNDPGTIWRALCYFSDPKTRQALAFVQFPQIFEGINKDDIYASENLRVFHLNLVGLDGLRGPIFAGSNVFFQRHAFFGSPSALLEPELPALSPTRFVEQILRGSDALSLAHQVAAAGYEKGTLWGTKMGMRYGSLIEDVLTGYHLQCEGWKSILCDPDRPAFVGGGPVTLVDTLSQFKRWLLGSMQVLFSKSNPLIFGARSIGILMALGYCHYLFLSILCIPAAIYAFVPQLALINGVSLFPKVDDPWFALYIFLFVGAYTQDLLDFLLANSSVKRWWNFQRMWMVHSLSSSLFAAMEFALGRLGIPVPGGYNVTSKVQDDHLAARYEQGVFEFGVSSPMFVPLSMAAVANLVALVAGLARVVVEGRLKEMALQAVLCGFVAVNCWPIYEAMALRKDSGRLPCGITMLSVVHVVVVCVASSLLLNFICEQL